MSASSQSNVGRTVERQIKLPLRKAVEIAWKNIRMRLSRSLLVTSGIVLALAFLMSILASDAVVSGMRSWMRSFNASDTGRFGERYRKLDAQRAGLEAKARPLYDTLRAAAMNPGKLQPGQAKIEPKRTFGMEMADMAKELSTALPGTADSLVTAVTVKPELVATMKEWMAVRQELKAVKRELEGAKTLEALMQATGVATTQQQILADRTQTRWLLGLALLVAFVGILNAMLMSVTERFREIGTMKCLGALDSFIVKLFLVESLFQGVFGTVLGVIAGLAMSFVGTSANYGGYAWQNVPWGQVGTGVALCLVVGVGLTVAGAVYPAWQAARMQPIEAMRVET